MVLGAENIKRTLEIKNRMGPSHSERIIKKHIIFFLFIEIQTLRIELTIIYGIFPEYFAAVNISLCLYISLCLNYFDFKFILKDFNTVVFGYAEL